MIKFRRVKEDDLICDLKAGDIVVVDENYDWDPDKCILIGKVIIDKVPVYFHVLIPGPGNACFDMGLWP
jgi:hypothetical protein